jgi:hypothetical protein
MYLSLNTFQYFSHFLTKLSNSCSVGHPNSRAMNVLWTPSPIDHHPSNWCRKSRKKSNKNKTPKPVRVTELVRGPQGGTTVKRRSLVWICYYSTFCKIMGLGALHLLANWSESLELEWRFTLMFWKTSQAHAKIIIINNCSCTTLLVVDLHFKGPTTNC